MSRRAEKAQEFARRYIELVEALQQQGVPEARAREEARYSATMLFLVPDPAPGEKCPMCGHVWESAT